MAAPMPPIDVGGMDLEGPADTANETDTDLDPQFAADASEAFPEMSDQQLSALYRAIMGCMSGYGGS
jgi:hypothetical protein